MSEKNLELIKNYLDNFSIETTPNVYNKYMGFTDLLDKNHSVYVTYLPNENSQNIIDTAKKLK